MIPALAVTVALTLATLIALVTTSTSSPRTQQRSADRRRKHVQRHPALVNLGDVERRLQAELLPHQVDFVLARVGRMRVDSATLWTWLERYGAEPLALALAAGHNYAWLLRHLRQGHVPDLGELEVLAYLSEPELFAADMSFARSGLAPR